MLRQIKFANWDFLQAKDMWIYSTGGLSRQITLLDAMAKSLGYIDQNT